MESAIRRWKFRNSIQDSNEDWSILQTEQLMKKKERKVFRKSIKKYNQNKKQKLRKFSESFSTKKDFIK